MSMRFCCKPAKTAIAKASTLYSNVAGTMQLNKAYDEAVKASDSPKLPQVHRRLETIFNPAEFRRI
jgi:hypothetical protein